MLRRALVPIALLLACNRAPAPEPAPAPAPTVEKAPAPPPPAPPPPAPVLSVVREATALQPGDVTATLAQDGETVVDPSTTFRVVLAAPCQDARLSLLDAQDAAVPATASVAIRDGTALTLTPSAPLVPGSRYALRLDGAVDRDLHAGDRTFTPGAYALKVAGELPPPPPRPAARKHRRK